jgi:hypothetical protein
LLSWPYCGNKISNGREALALLLTRLLLTRTREGVKRKYVESDGRLPVHEMKIILSGRDSIDFYPLGKNIWCYILLPCRLFSKSFSGSFKTSYWLFFHQRIT